MLFVVKSDPKFKRKKAISERISPEQKKLNDDYDIFQYLKNERNNPPVSLHVTSIQQNPVPFNSQKLITQFTTSKSTEKAQSQEKRTTLKKNKKSFFQLKLERYQNEVKQQQVKRKEELLLKSQTNLRKDLEDFQKISIKAKREFEERCNLYSKYYSEELIVPQGYRKEDLNLPLYKYSTIENTNKFKYLLKPEPTQAIEFTPKEHFEKFQTDTERVRQTSQTLQKLNINLIKKPNVIENQFFDAVLKNDTFTIKQLLMDNKQLVHIKNRTQETPLHIACKRNLQDMVNLLLDNHADQQARDLWGQTPRQLAFKLRNQEILKILSYK